MCGEIVLCEPPSTRLSTQPITEIRGDCRKCLGNCLGLCFPILEWESQNIPNPTMRFSAPLAISLADQHEYKWGLLLYPKL